MQEKIDWYENIIFRGGVNESVYKLTKYSIPVILITTIILFILSPITNLYKLYVFLIPILCITIAIYNRTQNLLFNCPIKVGVSKEGVYIEYQTEDVFIPWYEVKKLIPLSDSLAWELHRKDGRIFKLNVTEKIIKEKMHQGYREFKTDKRKKK